MKTIPRLAIALLAVSAAYSKPSAKDAAAALDAVVQELPIQIAPGAPIMPQLSQFGGPKVEVVSAEWGESFEQKIDDQAWAIFPVKAVLSTYHGKYSAKFALAMREEGGDFIQGVFRQPDIRPIEPTAEEQAAQKEAQAKLEAKISEFTKLIKEKWNHGSRFISASVFLTIEFDPDRLPGSMGAYYGKPFLFSLQTVDKKQFRLAATTEQVSEIIDFLERADAWSQTARENSVTDVKKPIGEIEGGDPNMKPGGKFGFVVDSSGNPFLEISAIRDDGSRAFRLSPDEIIAVRKAIEGAFDEISGLAKEAEKRATERVLQQNSKNDLFK